MNWIELAKEEGLALNVHLSDEVVEFLLWEKTAFPCGDEGTVREQIRAELNRNLFHWRSAYPPPDPTGPSRFERLGKDDADPA